MKFSAASLTLAGITAALLLYTPLHAQIMPGTGPGYGPGCREPGIFDCIASLDLSAQQRAEVRALQAETRERILPLRAELQSLAIPEALFAHTIDAAELESLMERKQSINTDIITLRHEAMISAVQLLTPGQRTAMLEGKDARPVSRGEGRRGRGGSDRRTRSDNRGMYR